MATTSHLPGLHALFQQEVCHLVGDVLHILMAPELLKWVVNVAIDEPSSAVQ